MSTLREKLPELLLEAVSVVLAVLVALAVDEWKEDRDREALARRATEAIVAELVSNRAELRDNWDANQDVLESVNEARQDTILPDEFSLQYEYSLLSDAAWETARMTQATQFMPMDRVRQLASVYELQALFQRSQDDVMDFITNVGEVVEQGPERIPRLVFGRLNTAVGMQQILAAAYDSTLVRLEPPPGEP